MSPLKNRTKIKPALIVSYLLPFPGVDDSFVDAEEVGDFSDDGWADTEELAPEVPPLPGSPVCW